MKQTLTVIKYGGNAMQSPALKKAFANDIAALQKAGVAIVLVHGGGPEIEALLQKTGKKSHFVDGLRYTDAETLELVQMALCGKVNKELAALLNAAGARAVGISGIDGGLFQAARITSKDGSDIGYVGEIVKFDGAIIQALLGGGFLPVVSPVALNVNCGETYSLNINADSAASGIAAELSAERLLLLTDTEGILRDVNDGTSLISKISAAELSTLLADDTLSGGMLPKARGCLDAIKRGVKSVSIIDGRRPHLLRAVLLENAAAGTTVTA
jgi:acetylglutamate kinase